MKLIRIIEYNCSFCNASNVHSEKRYGKSELVVDIQRINFPNYYVVSLKHSTQYVVVVIGAEYYSESNERTNPAAGT